MTKKKTEAVAKFKHLPIRCIAVKVTPKDEDIFQTPSIVQSNTWARKLILGDLTLTTRRVAKKKNKNTHGGEIQTFGNKYRNFLLFYLVWGKSESRTLNRRGSVKRSFKERDTMWVYAFCNGRGGEIVKKGCFAMNLWVVTCTEKVNKFTYEIGSKMSFSV